MPIGRFLEPSEVAEAIAFLLSDRASALTGATLRADEGFAVAEGADRDATLGHGAASGDSFDCDATLTKARPALSQSVASPRAESDGPAKEPLVERSSP